MSYRFNEIARELERRHGFYVADEYRSALEKDGHSEYERVYSLHQAADGADYSVGYKAQEAYRSLERKREREYEEEQSNG